MIDYAELKAAALAATPQNFDTAELKVDEGYCECPVCGGGGAVEVLGEYTNYDDVAIGVQFFGIGPEFGLAEAYYRAANPAAVLELIAENEALRKVANELRRWAQCENVHHCKEEFHEHDEECRVLMRIDKILGEDGRS